MLKNSFRSRLFAGMLTASLIPVLICVLLTVQITRLQMDRKNQANGAEQSQAVTQSMDAVSAGMASAAAALNDSSTVCRALLLGQADHYQVNALLFSVTENARSFADFFLYDMAGSCLYSTRSVSPGEPMRVGWGVLYRAAQSPGTVVYAGCEDPGDNAGPLLQAAALLRGANGKNAGFLVMRMYEAGFRALLDGKHPQSDVLVLSPYFHPVYSSPSYLSAEAAPALREMLLSGGQLQEEQYVNTLSRHEATGLYLVVRQPRMFNSSTVRLLYTAGILCGLICIGVSVPVSLSLSRRISRPVRQLEEAFAQVQQDDLETQVSVEGQDELARLAARFNRMVCALRDNRRELLRNQQELNQAQIRMLQAQLNPHFLCNTLDTMKWISKINKVPQVALMSTNLADILRFCISPEEFVPLYREIETLQRYIEIQKIRLSDRFRFTTEVEEELYDCRVPKMILQPIVENAILHGLEGVEDGRICLTARAEGPDRFFITVSDNGRGFPPEMLGRPYCRDREKARGHLGLYNADTILRSFFGEEWGLTLDNGPDGGARVTARMPIRYEEETEC